MIDFFLMATNVAEIASHVQMLLMWLQMIQLHLFLFVPTLMLIEMPMTLFIISIFLPGTWCIQIELRKFILQLTLSQLVLTKVGALKLQ